MQGEQRQPESCVEADAAQAAEISPDDARVERKIRVWESLRRWMLVLAAVLMIGGYAADFLPVLYSSALPLCVMLLATLRIKRLEGGK